MVYLANGGAPLGQAPLTNLSTSTDTFSVREIQAFMDQAFDVATQGIPIVKSGKETKDPQWPACLACAVVDRARRELGVARSGVCSSCLKKYCWS